MVLSLRASIPDEDVQQAGEVDALHLCKLREDEEQFFPAVDVEAVCPADFEQLLEQLELGDDDLTTCLECFN